AQQDALDFSATHGHGKLREDYMLKYQLDIESGLGGSLLKVSEFGDPTAYKLRIKTAGTDSQTDLTPDLLETFNWLLGLSVQSIAPQRWFTSTFLRDDEGRLTVKD